VLAVRIHALLSREINLFSGSTALDATDWRPFSMSDSFLLDGYTGKKIWALQELPVKPFYGPMMIASRLRHGGWVELGVAPPPPPSSDGTPQPYKLSLYLPLDAAPVAITPPPGQ
jgi:hypothetical protein